jgi:hypothetical protein
MAGRRREVRQEAEVHPDDVNGLTNEERKEQRRAHRQGACRRRREDLESRKRFVLAN